MTASALPFSIPELIWLIGVVGWYIIRLPFELKNRRKNTVVDNRRDVREKLLLACSLTGLGVVPMVHLFTGFPAFGDYRPMLVQSIAGALAMAGALYLFRRTHKDLGRNWSDSLQVRDAHTLITEGVYRHVRHPMYSAFWLMALGQLLLVPNLLVGIAGMVGFGTLFFGRVGREERMMLDAFGDQYRAYMARTARVVPRVY